MSQETKPVSFAVDGHPDEDQLLLALERELQVEDAAKVELHLGSCWSCRARYDEMQRGILAFVEYREKRYLPSLASPPNDFSSFRQQLREVLNERAAAGPLTRLWRKLTAYFSLARQLKWASAVATAMAIVILWVQVLNPPAISANELLTRAAAAQNPPAPTEESTQRRIVHQRMQIRSGNQTVVRDFEWTAGSPVEEPRWKIQPDPAAWNAPMTAEGFASWRNSLREKKDNVKRSGELLTLATTTSQDLIKEAWLVVRANDFHPVAQHLRFTDDRQLDFTELSFQIAEQPEAAAKPHAPAAAQPKHLGSAPVLPRADLDAAELQLRYSLFENHWDLGEELVIGRATGRVTLSGTVSSREREEAMRATLTALPNVQLALHLPAASHPQIAQSNGAAARNDQTLASTPLLRDTLEKTFASREERLAFVDRCLTDSDTALSHAWALKRLVDRYSAAEEQRLGPESLGKLHEMLRTHLKELSRAQSGLEPLVALLPASDAAAFATPTDWRAGIVALFTAVQRQDRLVASLVAVSQTDGQNLTSAAGDLRAAHQAINTLLGGLKDLAGNSMAK